MGAIYFPPTTKQTLPGSKKGKTGQKERDKNNRAIGGKHLWGGGRCPDHVIIIFPLSLLPLSLLNISFLPYFFSLYFLHLPPLNRSLFSATSDQDPSHWRLPPWERSRFKRICFKLRMQLRFLVYQNTALFSTFRPSSVLRDRRDISTFLDNLKV